MMTAVPVGPGSEPYARCEPWWGSSATTRFSGAVLAATLPGTGVPLTTTRREPVTETQAMMARADFVWPQRATAQVAATLSTVGTLSRLRQMSGLTIDQISRLMGVSRRAVHKWLNGGAMTAANEERLQHLFGVVVGLERETPDATRAALLSAANGPSWMYRLMRELPESARLQVPAYGARDRIEL